MDSIFNLASQRASWLSERQSLISQNVANANTPGFKTLEAPDFQSVMSTVSSNFQLATTNPAHLSLPDSQAFPPIESNEGDIWDGFHNENNVNLEQEMVKANEVHGDYALEAGIVKSFHSMVLSSLKG
jgi:flagellar basal-body rod protein FlgB